MTYQQIIKLQENWGITDTQNGINSGDIWKFEGSIGRMIMQLLEDGVVMLPKEPTYDYYGTQLPARQWLKDGTKGTFQNSVNFWQRVIDGDFEAIEYLESITETEG